MAHAGRARIVSVQVGLPRSVSWRGGALTTGIFKEPVSGSVRVAAHRLEGDGQADLSAHGGPSKAVYAYPAEHYRFWSEELPDVAFTFGHFGENLTVEGLHEANVCIGDRFRAGSAELVVTQPRTPCVKLAARFGRTDMVRRFERSGRSGFYLAVAGEGTVRAGDPVERLGGHEGAMSVADVLRLAREKHPDPSRLRRALDLPALSPDWRKKFHQRLLTHG